VWLPCILIGVWAAGLAADPESGIAIDKPNAVLGVMVGELVANPWLLGLLMAGVLAAIMSSLDSQFACLGTMFTNDIVIPLKGKDYYSDADIVKIARLFVVGVVAVAYVLSLLLANSSVFNLGLWCFTGFTALFPIIFAALYWKRVTAIGAYACIAVTTVLWIYWFHQSGYGANKGFFIWGMLPVAPLTFASTVALVMGSMVSSPPEARLVNRFFPRAAGDGRRRD
jgi:SSS family solute:Na+ symporter